MCLKIFITFTFTNNEAFKRAIEKLRANYGKYTIAKAQVNEIVKFYPYDINRQSLTFTQLCILDGDSQLKCKYHLVHSWDTLEKAVKSIGDKDVYGSITVEKQ